MTLPSGVEIHYTYTDGTLSGMSVDREGQRVDVISDFIWSQIGQSEEYDYDLDGRLTLIHDPVLNREFDYDVGNKITGWLDNESGREVFTFDKLNRLKTQATLNIEYDYDYNGNRTTQSD